MSEDKKRGNGKADPKTNHNLEEDFVFPIFYNEREKNITRKIKKIKNKTKISAHILDLRHPVEEEPVVEITPPVTFNPDNWFSNFKNIYPEPQRPQKEVDFEAPDYSELPGQKIKYSKPPKTKTKSHVKLNLQQDMLEQLAKPSPAFKQQPASLSLIKKFFLLIINLIALPFKILDFVVDRTLKIIWQSIKFILLGSVHLIQAIFLNLKTILLNRPRAEAGVSSISPVIKGRINYRPILYFALICLIIVLPLQVLNWQQKTSNIKGQVLGQSMQGLDALKNASLLSQDFDFEQAGLEFNKAYFNFKVAHYYLNNLDIFSQQLIKMVPEAKIAEELLMIGQLSAKLGQDISQLGQELQENTVSSDSQMGLIKKINLTTETLNQIEPNILELLERLERIDTQTLAKYVGQENLQKIILFKSSLPILKQNLNQLKILNNFLANFLGQRQSQKYLIIFQNNSELRPTGGFMGSYALVEIKNGEIIALEVPGGGFYDLKAANQVSVAAPKPFHLFSPAWQIWNANWFPDWPSSAEKISWFYENSLSGVTVDGIISLTPDVLEDFLEIIGPIEMPAYEKIITSENFVKELQMATEIEYDPEENQPKKIIADLMPKILTHVFNLKVEQTPAFLQLLIDNLNKKNILLWFKEQNMQDIVENFSWAGKIKSSLGDYLMVVHTNIGGGKTDRVIDNKILHHVEIDQGGNIFDTVTLTRSHHGQIGDIFEDQNNVDYIRFYVPQGSQLISAQGFDYLPTNLFKIAENPKSIAADTDLERWEKNPILEEKTNTRITQEFGKTCFGNWLMVKPGQEKTVTLKYKLPFEWQKSPGNLLDKLVSYIKPAAEELLDYSLIIQKQPGLNSTDFISQINLPADWQVANSQAKNELQQNLNKIIYQDNLETDGYYGIKIK